MDVVDKIRVARRILNNAVSLNLNKEIILELSQQVDKYVVQYYREMGIRGKKGEGKDKRFATSVVNLKGLKESKHLKIMNS